MKTIVILSALLGLAVCDDIFDSAISSYNAVPNLPNVGPPFGDTDPQEVDVYNQDQTVADVVSVAGDTNNATVVSSDSVLVSNVVEKRLVDIIIEKRAICTTRSYNGPQVSTPTDSPSAFLNYAPFSEAATAAAQPENIPAGWDIVPDFINLDASAQTSNYLTYTTMGVSSYDPSICAAKCDKIKGCNAFNMYYERTPLIISTSTGVPDPVSCPGLDTSPSATLLKCAFYGTPFTALTATNAGQFQGKFHVVVAGSNAYFRSLAPEIDGYVVAPLPGGAINAPAPVNQHGYLRVQTFGQNVPFDPSLCAASCAEQTAYNAAHDIGLGPCYFFNVYVLQENGANGVLTCTYFSIPYGASYATMSGQYDSQGDFFGVVNSYGYYLDGYFTE